MSQVKIIKAKLGTNRIGKPEVIDPERVDPAEFETKGTLLDEKTRAAADAAFIKQKAGEEAAKIAATALDKKEAPATPTYGNFYVNGGNAITGEYGLRQLEEANRRGGSGAMTKAALDAYKAGHNVYYTGDGNTLQIQDANGADVTWKFYNSRANTARSDFGKAVGAIFNSEGERSRRSGLELGKVIPEAVKPVEEPAKKVFANGNGYQWYTTTDDKKKTIFDAGSILNQNAEKQLRTSLSTIMSNSREDLDKNFDTSAWGTNLDTIYQMKEAGLLDDPEFLNGLLDRMKAGKLKDGDSDSAFLNLLGYGGWRNAPAAAAVTSSGQGGGGSQGGGTTVRTASAENPLVTGESYGGITIGGRNADGTYNATVGDLAGYDPTSNLPYYLGDISDIPDEYRSGFYYNGRLYTEDQARNIKGSKKLTEWFEAGKEPTLQKWGEAATRVGMPGFSYANPSIFNSNERIDFTGRGALNQRYKDGEVGILDVSTGYGGLGDDIVLKVFKKENGKASPTVSYIKVGKNGSIKPWTAPVMDIDSNAESRFETRPLDANGFGNIYTMNVGTGNDIMFNWNPRTNKYNFNKGGNTFSRDLTPEEYQEIIKKYNQLEKDKNGARVFTVANNGGYNNRVSAQSWLSWLERDLLKHPLPSTTTTSQPATTPQTTKAPLLFWDTAAGNTATPGFKPAYKEGGKIDWNRLEKLQYGGGIRIKEGTNEGSSYFTNDHVGKSDGGWTSAEKLQFNGALADLLGVGLSFAPGMASAVASTTAGLAGTGLRFAGDIKQDGLDWGDAKRLGLNVLTETGGLALSAVNLDSALKLKKAQKAAQTLVKYTGKIGTAVGAFSAGSAAYNALIKVANGEKLTSEDWTRLVEGLGGAAVAGRGVAQRVGKSRLAARLDSDIEAPKNFSIKKGDQTKTIKVEDVDEIVSTKKTAKEIKSAIAEQMGVDVKDIDLEDFGIAESKSLANRLTFWRKDKNYSFDAPEGHEARSTWSYFKGRGLDESLGGLAGRMTPEQYRALMEEGGLAARAARRMGLEGRLKKADLAPNEEKGWMFNPRTWRKPLDRFTTSRLEGATDGLAPRLGSAIPEAAGESAATLARRAKIKEFTAAKAAEEKEAIEALLKKPTPQLAKDRTKKILKTAISAYSNTGANFSPDNVDDALGLLKNPKAIKVLNANPEDAREIVKGIAKELRGANSKRGQKAANLFNDILKQQRRKGTITFKEGGLIPMAKFGSALPGGISVDLKTGSLNNYIPAALDLSAAIKAQITSNKSYEDKRKAFANSFRLQDQTYQLSTPVYNTNDISHSYNLAEKNYLEGAGNNQYSDLRAQMANKQVEGVNLLNLATTSNATRSQYNAQYGDKVRMVGDQNAQLRVGNANENRRNYITARTNYDLLKPAHRDSDQAMIWQPLSQQYRQNIRNSINTNRQLANSFELNKLQQAYSDKRDELLRPFKAEWQQAVKGGKFEGTFDEYMVSTPEINQRVNAAVSLNDDSALRRYRDQVYTPAYEALLFKQNKPVYKEGGSIRYGSAAYKHKTVGEEIAVDTNKNAQKAAQKMTDHLMDMLKKLLLK